MEWEWISSSAFDYMLHSSCRNYQLHGSCASLGSIRSSHLDSAIYSRGYAADIFTFAYSYSNQSFSVDIAPFYSCLSMVFQKFCNCFYLNRMLFLIVLMYLINFFCISFVYVCVYISLYFYLCYIHREGELEMLTQFVWAKQNYFRNQKALES